MGHIRWKHSVVIPIPLTVCVEANDYDMRQTYITKDDKATGVPIVATLVLESS